MPTLYIFSGLPGSGKTRLSQALARHLPAVHLRIDTIEQALRDLCGIDVEGEGYRLAYRVAADNLRLGFDVIVDSCNPIRLTRDEYEDVARSAGADFRNIEVVCSDEDEHRRRVESRDSDIPGLKLPSWEDVRRREFHPWHKERIVVDTAAKTADESLAELVAALAESK